MAIVKYNPLRELRGMQEQMNRLLNLSWNHDLAGEDIKEGIWQPAVDIYETEEGVVVQVDLPGVKKEDVSVEVKNNLLVIQGMRQVDSPVNEDRYYRRERTCGTFLRSFTLRETVPPESIKAAFKNGVLSVLVPRPEEEKPKKISVSID